MYEIELSDAGRHAHPERDKHLERMVLFLIETMGVDAWAARKADIIERMRAKFEQKEPVPPEGVSIRDRRDEIGWYIYQCEQTIADPPSVNSDQASRVLPYFSALGRKLDALRAIDGVESRIAHLLRREDGRDPDQGIFELLVGATYAGEGWSVRALPEDPASRTPDFQVYRAGEQFLVECKRLTRRSEYTEKERSAWLRLWGPTRDWLVEHKVSKIWTVLLHEEIHQYPPDFLLTIVRSHVGSGGPNGTVIDDERCNITVRDVDYSAIERNLESVFVKCNSSREREIITGLHQPDYGLTHSIGGKVVALGSGATPSDWYWEAISFVSAAYWKCDAETAISSKARNILTRLAEGVSQLSEQVPGIVHIGVETADGDDVEHVRSEKVMRSVVNFDPRGKRLASVFLHYFRSDSPPDEAWAIDETVQTFGGLRSPLRTGMLLADDSVRTFRRAHWEAPRGSTS